MGTHYSIELYFPIENLGKAIQELMKIVDKRDQVASTLQLPTNERVKIFHYETSRPRIMLQNEGYTFFSTCLLFQLDDVIKRYIAERNEAMLAYDPTRPIYDPTTIVNGIPHISLGGLDIFISIMGNLPHLDIDVAASVQNDLLLKSKSIHQAMLNILNEANGISAYINTGADYLDLKTQ